MHLLFMIRGNKWYVDQFIKELEGKYLPFKFEGKDKALQLGVRPIQLYEVAFPKEHKDLICATILGQDGSKYADKYKPFEKFFYFIRKMLGYKKIGKFDPTHIMPATKMNIDTIGIGIKEDKEYEFGEGI